MKYSVLGLLFIFTIANTLGCSAQNDEKLRSARRMAERLKNSSPKTTDSVKIKDYVILGEKELLIRATLLSWDSKVSSNSKLMQALAHDNAKTFACNDKVIRELLADGVELSVIYASADHKDALKTTVRNENCLKDLTKEGE